MKEKLDLLLVNPSDRKKTYGSLGPAISAIEPPVWTGLLAAFVRKEGFSVKIIDADAEGWDAEDTSENIVAANPVLVGISAVGANPSASSTPKMAAASRVLNSLKDKAPHLLTFLYGIHPSSLPEKTLTEEKADFICRGECFYTIAELLKKLKSDSETKDYKIEGLWYKKDNKTIANGWGRIVRNIDELPLIAWDLLPMDKYRAHNWHCFGHLGQRQPYAVIYTSLGCPYNCRYCNIHALYEGKPGIRFRSPEKVIEEIDFLAKNYKVRNIKMLDELFAIKETRVMEICDLITMRGYDLNIWAYARIDTVNRKMLEKMKAAGINWLAYGIESASKKVRDGVRKGRFDKALIKKAIEMTHDAGIYIIGNFIFGLPDDDLDTMQETLNMAKEFNFEFVNFYVIMAYPGSQLYEDAVQEGLELPAAWPGYAQFSEETFPLPSKHLSNKEILRFRDKAFDEYFSDPRYIGMITKKFGLETARHIKEMCKIKINRKLLKDEIFSESERM